MCCLIKCIFACVLPPIAVLIEKGCSGDLCLNIILTLCGFIPGCLHAYCIICESKPGPQYISANKHTTNVNISEKPVPQQTVAFNQMPMTAPHPYQVHQQIAAHPYYPGPMSNQPQPLAPGMGDQQTLINMAAPPTYFDSKSSAVV